MQIQCNQDLRTDNAITVIATQTRLAFTLRHGSAFTQGNSIHLLVRLISKH